MNRPRALLRLGILALAGAAIGTLLFLFAMGRGLNHDEHQFLAPGVLISREGLLPYRDYPMFHLPNLAFAYAGLDRLTHQPVLSAKLLSVVASTGIAIILLALASRRTADTQSAYSRWCLAGALVLIFLGDPLFTFTAGKTWNHELPAFLLILAIALQVQGVSSGRWGWFAASGICGGLAVGSRLTFAPAAVALPATLFFAPLPSRRRLQAFGIWTVASILAMAPSWYFLATERERFLFDNLQFPRLRLADLADTRAHKTMAWWRKLRFIGKEVLERSIPLSIAYLALVVPFIRRWIKTRTVPDYAAAVVLTLLVPLVAGCALPSRFQYQHFYAVLPLLCLGIAYGIRRGLQRWQQTVLAAAAIWVSIGIGGTDPGHKPSGVRAYRQTVAMLDRANWFTTGLREDYAFVRSDERILTLAPTGVLEAGGRIYPEFATGPFAWRAAHLLAPADRERLGFVAPEDLDRWLDQRIPDAILTGVEDEALEKPFIAFAEAKGFTQTKVGRQRTVWRPSILNPPLPR